MLLDFLRRLFTSSCPPTGNAETAGPPLDEHPLVTGRDVLNANVGTAGTPDTFAPSQDWDLGLWLSASFKAMHPGRVGGTIKPLCSVVHTTDMHPDDFDALVKSWTSQPGAGNGAHFLIGRTADQGVIQFASITRNANHAGGGASGHGYYRTRSGALVHPNTISVGIELHCAGRLYKDSSGRWRCGEYQAGKLVFSGSPLPLPDVHVDSNGHGWHMITEYQRGRLLVLLENLKACFPPGFNYTLSPNGGYLANGVPWASIPSSQVVGHVTLDPRNKVDPGPVVIALIKENF